MTDTPHPAMQKKPCRIPVLPLYHNNLLILKGGNAQHDGTAFRKKNGIV
jgi:hypothetical protein